MADNTEQKPEEMLLDDILNGIDVTFEDEGTRKKIGDIMQRGIGRLEGLKGEKIDFTQDMAARELLFSYCRYGRSNAIEQFEHDFSSQLTLFALDAAVAVAAAGTAESGAENESDV